MVRFRRARITYLATTRGQAELLNWLPLKDFIDNLVKSGLCNRDDFELLEGKLRCTCNRTGSVYQMAPAEDKRDIEKLRGQPFDEVQIDEGASHDIVLLDHLVRRIVGPRMSNQGRKGCIVICGTPGATLNGLFYDVTNPGSAAQIEPLEHGKARVNGHHVPFSESADFDSDLRAAGLPPWIGWSSHAWSLADLANLDDAAERYPGIVLNWESALAEKAREQWSDDNPVWMREYLGRWAADDTANIYQYRANVDGKPWNQWNPPKTREGWAVLPDTFKDWHYGYGMDMGSKDPFALNVFAFSPSDPKRTLYHVYCFGKTQMYAKLIAELMIGPVAVTKVLRGENIDYEKTGEGAFSVTGWPTALVADSAALGEAIINELAQVYGIRIKPADKSPKYKFGAIEGANGDFVDGRYKILKGSELERQLESLQWKRDEYGRVQEGKGDRNDHTDSMLYVRLEIVGLFASGIVVAKEPDKSAYSDPMDLGEEEPGEFDGLLSDPNYDQGDWGNQ